MSYARVVPAHRTPFGVQAFDYKIPEGTEYQVGSLVQISFRKKIRIGLVLELMSHTTITKNIEPILSTYQNICLPSATVNLLRWTAERTFSSYPTVLSSWLRQMPKRKKPLTERTSLHPATKSTLTTYWNTDHHERMIQTIQTLLTQNKRILYITPWKHRVEQARSLFPEAGFLHGDMPTGAAFQAWSTFLSGEKNLLVTTRLGAWCGSWADEIILDEPETDEYKQDELAPRYDARLLALWAHKHGHASLSTFGLTPPLHVTAPHPDIHLRPEISYHHPHGASSIPCIQAETLNAILAHTGPVTIFHPIKGVFARVICQDCRWALTCSTCQGSVRFEQRHGRCTICHRVVDIPLTCPTCNNTHLHASTPGLTTIQAEWKKQGLRTVDWRDTSVSELDRSFSDHALVVCTDPRLLGGGVDDVRRKERQSIIYRRLAQRVYMAQGRLLLQIRENEDSPWIDWLTKKGMDTFRIQELKERKLFFYPPSIKLVKILVNGTKANSQILQQELAQATQPDLQEIRGPFFVDHRAPHREMRHVLHLLFPASITERRLIDLLTPFAGRALIDLDPIQFFQ